MQQSDGSSKGGVGLVLYIIPTLPYRQTLTIWVPNIAMLTAYGLIWAGLRTYAGKKVPWLLVPAGGVVWIGFCLWPSFIRSLDLRVATFSIIMLSYMLASLRDMWPSWRQDALGLSPVMFFLAGHSMFYIYRIIPHPASGDLWIARTGMQVTIFESILFILGLSFSMLLMVRARAERHYQHASRHDDLTGLYNRRALFEHGCLMHARAVITKRPLAAVMCDLDWFKSINDQYGHGMGDKVLVLFAKLLLELAPKYGVCARLGGEEFLMLVPNATLENVQRLADSIHNRLAKAMTSLPLECSTSVGTSISSDTDNSLDWLITRADQALYAAKTAGRNCSRAWIPEQVNVEKPNTRSRTLQHDISETV